MGNVPGNRLARRWLDGEPKARGEADGPEQSQVILREPFISEADRTQYSIHRVTLTADVVDHLFFDRIEEHPIDREVAPLGVFFRRAEDDTLRSPPVSVR